MNKWLFGIDCPGCGTQRAFALLIDGQFADAFKMFPAIYTTMLFFVVVALNFLDRRRSYHKILVYTAIANVGTMLIAYFIKIYLILNQ